MSFEPRPCKNYNCQHIAYSKANYFAHRSICNSKMAKHDNHRGFPQLEILMSSKRQEEVEIKFKAMDQIKRIEILECLDIFDEERKKAKEIHEQFEKKAKKFHTLKTILSNIKIITVDEESNDGIFSSDPFDEAKQLREKLATPIENPPEASRSLISSLTAAVGSLTGSSSKKRKATDV